MQQVISGRADRPTLIEVIEPAQQQDMAEQVIDSFVIGPNETVKYTFPTASAGYRLAEPSIEHLQEYAQETGDPVVQAQLEGKNLADPNVQRDLRDPRTGEPLVDRDGNRLTTATTQPGRTPEVQWPTTQPEMDAGSARVGEMDQFTTAQEEALNQTPMQYREVEPRTQQEVTPSKVARGAGGTGEPVGEVRAGTQQPTPASQPGNPPSGEPSKPNPQTQPGEPVKPNPQTQPGTGDEDEDEEEQDRQERIQKEREKRQEQMKHEQHAREKEQKEAAKKSKK